MNWGFFTILELVYARGRKKLQSISHHLSPLSELIKINSFIKNIIFFFNRFIGKNNLGSEMCYSQTFEKKSI